MIVRSCYSSVISIWLSNENVFSKNSHINKYHAHFVTGWNEQKKKRKEMNTIVFRKTNRFSNKKQWIITFWKTHTIWCVDLQRPGSLLQVTQRPRCQHPINIQNNIPFTSPLSLFFFFFFVSFRDQQQAVRDTRVTAVSLKLAHSVDTVDSFRFDYNIIFILLKLGGTNKLSSSQSDAQHIHTCESYLTLDVFC